MKRGRKRKHLKPFHVSWDDVAHWHGEEQKGCYEGRLTMKSTNFLTSLVLLRPGDLAKCSYYHVFLRFAKIRYFNCDQ